MNQMHVLSFQYCFHHLRRPDSEVPLHAHRGYELVYYSSGEGVLSLGGKEHPFSGGMISLAYPETLHTERWSEDTHVWCVIFQIDDAALLPEGVYPDPDGEIFRLLSALFAEQQENRFYRDEISCNYLEIILRLMARSVPNQDNRRQPSADRLESVFYYIQDYFHTDIDFSELAQSIGYSYDRFRHLFKARYHVSPKKMVLAKRMELAESLLRNTNDKIESIARTVGFASVPQFNVIFKQHRGMTPKAYRAAQRGAGTSQ
ncbi:MAG: helix-turn-helix transcriptional regulator [Clostridia bacterium]|nr:helix-turn-helix transcriptional regulator [Clostridia bacterium]